jgi:hypothetical protein
MTITSHTAAFGAVIATITVSAGRVYRICGERHGDPVDLIAQRTVAWLEKEGKT